jgi:hypothetical protein
MRSLGTRRAALVAGVATVAAVALAGCSAGQIAETALKVPSNMGVNAENSNNSLAIRNLMVVYNGIDGYPAGASAPLEVTFANNTTAEITVRISSQPLQDQTEGQGVVSARSVGLVGGTPSAEPSGSPAAASAEPAQIAVGPLGYASFLPSDKQSLQAIGLSDKLLPGMSVNLVLEFSDGADPLVVQAPVGVPLEPASRAPGNEAETHEEGE